MFGTWATVLNHEVGAVIQKYIEGIIQTEGDKLVKVCGIRLKLKVLRIVSPSGCYMSYWSCVALTNLFYV